MYLLIIVVVSTRTLQTLEFSFITAVAIANSLALSIVVFVIVFVVVSCVLAMLLSLSIGPPFVLFLRYLRLRCRSSLRISSSSF